MNRITFVLLFFLLSFSFAFTQSQSKRKAVFFELAGSGGLGSLNYENEILRKGPLELSWRAGFSLAPVDRNNGMGIVVPVMIHSLIGKSGHKFELGLGQGITVTTKGSFFFLATASAGYRYQTPSGKWFFRITYTPLISYIVDRQVQHWAGVSVGLNIKRQEK